MELVFSEFATVALLTDKMADIPIVSSLTASAAAHRGIYNAKQLALFPSSTRQDTP